MAIDAIRDEIAALLRSREQVIDQARAGCLMRAGCPMREDLFRLRAPITT